MFKNPQNLKVFNLLVEANRSELINKGKKGANYKDTSKGKNRYERRLRSRISSSVATYNKIDMDSLFKRDILTVGIQVHGETDDYIVTMRFSGLLAELRQQLKNNNNKLEYKVIARAMSRVFNSGDINMHCNCPDATYRQNYYQNKNGYGTMYEPRPSNITNPNDTLGSGCKHTMLCLSNLDWMMKVASVVNNYIKYAQEHLQKLYAEYIFPKVYGMKYDKAVQQELFFTGLLPSDQDTLSKVASTNLGQKDAQGKFIKGNDYRFVSDKEKAVEPDENQKEFKFSNDKKELELPDTQRQMTIDDYDDEGKKVVGNGQLIKDKRKYTRKNPLVGKKIQPVSKDQISIFDDEENDEEES